MTDENPFAEFDEPKWQHSAHHQKLLEAANQIIADNARIFAEIAADLDALAQGVAELKAKLIGGIDAKRPD